MADDVERQIETFLNAVRRKLRGLDAENTREILEELRSHVVEKAAMAGEATSATVAAALRTLGDPEELASQYVTDELLARAETSRSPFRMLDSLFFWASISLVGFVVLLGTLVGYFLGVVFVLVAALKPFHPATAGLWVSRDVMGDMVFSLHLGFGTAPAVGREVLGWWIVPIGLVAGCELVILTTRLAHWCAQLYRRSRALPRTVSIR
jgi:uncharacterized membrane protein